MEVLRMTEVLRVVGWTINGVGRWRKRREKRKKEEESFKKKKRRKKNRRPTISLLN